MLANSQAVIYLDFKEHFNCGFGSLAEHFETTAAVPVQKKTSAQRVLEAICRADKHPTSTDRA